MSAKKAKKSKNRGSNFKQLIDPNVLATLVDKDRAVLRMDTEGEIDDRAAYWELINGVTRAVTGLDVLSEIRTTFNDFYTTLSNAKQKVLVIHAVGKFNEDDYNHLLMVIKKSIYVVAVGPSKGGWMQVKSSREYPIHGATHYSFSEGYYSLPNGLGSADVKIGFQELKFAIKRLIFGEPTSKDLLTVAMNVCEAVRYPFIANQVSELIGRHAVFECCVPCPKSVFLARNWEHISLAIEQVQNGQDWKFDYEDNIIGGEEFVTKESVFALVRVIQKSGESGKHKKGKDKK